MFKFISKVFIITIITLFSLILIKSNKKVKRLVYNYVYSENISFSKIYSLYRKYLGSNALIDKKILTPVFNEQLVYSNKEKYKEGLKLSVEDEYLVPNLDTGLVIFIGKKEGYGNVVIVEGLDGVNIWYGNLSNVNVKLYDYIDKGSLIGNCNNNLYLVYKKDGKIIDIQDKI